MHDPELIAPSFYARITLRDVPFRCNSMLSCYFNDKKPHVKCCVHVTLSLQCVRYYQYNVYTLKIYSRVHLVSLYVKWQFRWVLLPYSAHVSYEMKYVVTCIYTGLRFYAFSIVIVYCLFYTERHEAFFV